MLKRFILWDYARATWQYDVMVGIILLFIFLTPREWFRDQPRIPNAGSVAMLPSENGSAAFWLDTELLANVAEDQQLAKATTLLRSRTGNNKIQVTRIEAVRDSESSLQGYLAIARP
jgi:hypothetical protein